jgi:hypothetical protein
MNELAKLQRAAFREDVMSDSIKLCSVTLECPDAGALARFYVDITGGKVTFLHESWATV